MYIFSSVLVTGFYTYPEHTPGGESRHFLPGVKSLPHLLPVERGGQEVVSQANVLSDMTWPSPKGAKSRMALS